MREIIPAFLALCARDLGKGQRDGNALFQEREDFPVVQIHGEEIEPRAAAHGTEVDDVALFAAVAKDGRHHVFDRMERVGGEKVAGVGFF